MHLRYTFSDEPAEEPTRDALRLLAASLSNDAGLLKDELVDVLDRLAAESKDIDELVGKIGSRLLELAARAATGFQILERAYGLALDEAGHSVKPIPLNDLLHRLNELADESRERHGDDKGGLDHPEAPGEPAATG